MNARILSLTVASAALIGLAACNSGQEAEAPATEATPAPAASTTPDPVVGGAPMSPKETIVANAAKASNLTTLVSAVQTAGLVEPCPAPAPSPSSPPTTPPSRRSRPRRARP